MAVRDALAGCSRRAHCRDARVSVRERRPPPRAPARIARRRPGDAHRRRSPCRADPMAKISNLDFYAILGVHPNAEDIVIRAAFKALAQRYHPDRFTGAKDEAHRRMADLTNAYETLADPARRRKYDRRRGLVSRQARFYFKNPARERQQPFSALAARAAARKAQRYRMAVYVLMVVVVILSGFNSISIRRRSRSSSRGIARRRAPSRSASRPRRRRRPRKRPPGRARGCADNHGERQGPAHRARKHASDHLQCDGLAGARTERLRCTGCSDRRPLRPRRRRHPPHPRPSSRTRRPLLRQLRRPQRRHRTRKPGSCLRSRSSRKPSSPIARLRRRSLPIAKSAELDRTRRFADRLLQKPTVAPPRSPRSDYATGLEPAGAMT